MPQKTITTSSNISAFGFSVNVDIYNRQMIFDTSALTTYISSGISNVLGIAFSFVDSDGVDLLSVDWTAPQIIPSAGQQYTLDLTTSPVNFLFQDYTLIGYIKDADGTVYETDPILKRVGQPANVNDEGYVPGDINVIPDCANKNITVKEFTLMVYCNKTPLSVTKSGTLYYPTGTISPIAFTGTPFVNNAVFTGHYRVNCLTVAKYDFDDNFYVSVSYLTDMPYNVTCGNFLGDINCCISDTLNTYKNNCENAVGQAALQRYNSVMPFIINGMLKQNNGQDASQEVADIRKMLNCDCGTTSVKQVEQNPTNPAVYSIVLNGVGGITIPSATISGSTKTYNIASNAVQVVKGDIGDLAYTITTDNSTQYVTKYKLTFNYDIESGYILTAIAANPTLLNQLNALVTGSGGSIVGLDGGCVIDLTQSNYAVSQSVNSGTLITNITINGVIHAAPGSLFANDATGIASWLNSLALGTFTAVLNSGVLTIQSVSNVNSVSTITLTTPNITKQFSSTNATLLQVLQAMVNYLCAQNALQIALGNNLALCTFDYNGSIVNTNYSSGSTQGVFNAGVASAICNIANRMSSIAGATCASLKTIFIDRAGVSFGSTDRIYGTLGGNCASITDQQMANLVVAAVSKYSDVKTAWCAIDCTAPGSCPNVVNTSLGMSGANIGIYGLTWGSSTVATQTVTVKYRVSGTTTYTTATNALNILPNGSISGSSPYLITGVTTGTSYDILITNNCGGSGFTKQITTPTGSVYSGSYLLDNVLYNICGESPVTLYSNAPFASGVTMFTNIGLTTPITGYTYITNTGSNIYAIDTASGVVGVDTGSACANGTAGNYLLGNSTASICASTPVTLYTNGAFTVGGILYTDPALSVPQTGFSYVVNSNIIYNLNSSSGAIVGNAGLGCNTPSFTQTSISNTGVGGTTTQTALVGSSIAAGNRFIAQVYSHQVTYIAVLGDTPTSVATALKNAINATSEASWNSASSAPSSGTTGFPPTATSSGANITITLDYVHSFAFNAYVS